MAPPDDSGPDWTRDATAVRRAARQVLAQFREERRGHRLARTEAAVSADIERARQLSDESTEVDPGAAPAATLPPQTSAEPELHRRVARVIATLCPGRPSLTPVPVEAPGDDLEQLGARVARVTARLGAGAQRSPEYKAPPASAMAEPSPDIAPHDPLTALPRLGPMMAARLRALGLETVGDLAAHDADALAAGLGPAARYCPLHEWLTAARSACTGGAAAAAE